jgi:phage major head subunit gpT-like protein
MENQSGINGSAVATSSNLVTTILNRLFTGAANEAREGKATALDPIIFNQETATNAAVNSSVQGGGGYFQKTLNDVSIMNNATINAANTRVTNIAQFQQELPISRTFMEDQQLGSVMKAVEDRGKAWAATRDRNAFGVYALGFTTQTTIDGTTLFSDTHTNENGDTVDNKSTLSLSDDNLNTNVVALRNQKAQGGYLSGYDPDFLLVPNQLHRTGTQITKSVLRAGSGNNDLNYWSDIYPGMKVMYNAFLDETSTTAYFVGAKNHGVKRFMREAFSSTLVPWQYQGNNQYLYKMISREEVDSIYYNGLQGSTGTV